MKISARNVLSGKSSADSRGIKKGKRVHAVIKASNVMIAADD